MSLFTDTLSRFIDGPLRDNSFAKSLLAGVAAGKKMDMKSIVALSSIEEDIPKPQYKTTIIPNDHRARGIMIRGIRRFPVFMKDFYSMDFSGGGEAKSSVCLGTNGVGKSSVFAALEMIYLRHLESAASRGYITIDDQLDYLRHLNTPLKDAVIYLHTSNTKGFIRLSLDALDPHPLSQPAFFCTEWDIERLSKETSADYIANQLGLSDYLHFLNLIKTLKIDFQRKRKVLTDLETELDKVNGKLKVPSDLSESEQLELNIQKQRLESRIHHYYLRHPVHRLSLASYHRIIQTEMLLNQSYQDLITQLLLSAEIVFSQLFNKYLNEDIHGISLKKEEESFNLKIKLMALNPITGEQIGEVEPRKYLNTFRFKLYCVSLKISLALCCKKIYNLNAPIVIDDVFDSSDFQNREKIRHFIFDLFRAHDEIFDNHKSPLQLIFFTQDDVIGDSVFDGIRNFAPVQGGKYGRIFNYTEADEKNDKIPIMLEGEEVNRIDLEDIIQRC